MSLPLVTFPRDVREASEVSVLQCLLDLLSTSFWRIFLSNEDIGTDYFMDGWDIFATSEGWSSYVWVNNKH